MLFFLLTFCFALCSALNPTVPFVLVEMFGSLFRPSLSLFLVAGVIDIIGVFELRDEAFLEGVDIKPAKLLLLLFFLGRKSLGL